MLHGAGMFTYIWMMFGVNVDTYSIYVEHMGLDVILQFEGVWFVYVNASSPLKLESLYS